MKKESKIVSRIQPLEDRVLLKEITAEDKEKTTKSGLIIPVTVNDDKGAKRGHVISVGPGKYENGTLIPMTIKPDSEVLWSWGDKIKIDEEEYYLVRQSEIIAVVK